MDRNGKLITQHQGERMTRLLPNGAINLGRPNCDDTISIYYNEQIGYLLPTGQLFANRLFSGTYGIVEDTLAYKENEKWGLINSTGDIVVEANHERMSLYGQRYFKVRDKNNVFLLDHLGERFDIEDDPNYSVNYDVRLAPREAYLKCDGDLKRKSQDGKWGVIDSGGSVIIPLEFDAISCPDENLNAMVPDKSRGTWCLISSPYKLISHQKCNRAYSPTVKPSHFNYEKLSSDLFENSVLWTQAYLQYGEGRRIEPPKYISDGVMGRGVLLAYQLHNGDDSYPIKLD